MLLDNLSSTTSVLVTPGVVELEPSNNNIILTNNTKNSLDSAADEASCTQLHLLQQHQQADSCSTGTGTPTTAPITRLQEQPPHPGDIDIDNNNTPTPNSACGASTAVNTATAAVLLPNTTMADKRRYFERDSRDSGYHGGNSSDAGSRSSSKGGQSGSDDDPPNSRLFILCGRNVTEDQLREAFDRYGVIKELWIVKDKSTGDSKGVAYITYMKTSEAAVAMEEMNGKYIENNTKPLKVLIANSRDQGSRRDANEEERLLRLFIIVPKSMSESDLKNHFQQFGDIERCNIVRDRHTKESKGYAYVSFHRISHAAKAFEGCDRSFKPRFADPKPPKAHDDRYSSAHGSTTGGYDMHDYGVIESSYSQMLNHHHHEQHHGQLQHSSPSIVHHSHSPQQAAHLTIIGHGSLNQDQLWRLCDFFPGFEYCSLRTDPKTRQCYGSAIYNSSQAAVHARDKLHGFEYPPGQRLIVKLDGTSQPIERHSGSRYGNIVSHNGSTPATVQSGSLPGVPRAGTSTLSPDLVNGLIETVAHAQSIIQQASLGHTQHPQCIPTHQHQSASSLGESYDPSYCSVKLPAPQPLAPMDSSVKERLFVVCHPSPPPLYALKDTFGRFGNLIDIFMLNGKNFGYAKYADKNSADDARTTLHGQEVCGMRLKVFVAEPQDQQKGNGGGSGSSVSSGGTNDPKCKRLRTDYSADIELE